jgi:GH25 family lysozyme M1 (1,4-beta-N-acetylmuramidase)
LAPGLGGRPFVAVSPSKDVDIIFALNRRINTISAAVIAAAVVSVISSTPAVGEAARPHPPAAVHNTRLTPGNAQMGWRSHRTVNEAGVNTLRSSSGPVQLAALAPIKGVSGIDVSSYQGNVNWAFWAARGLKFAYIKATEGSTYRNRYFKSQFNGSRSAGLVRGAYHFANPGGASGKTQAGFFVQNGGSWSRDGWTLPGVLDIEYNPYGAVCYGRSKEQMVQWVTDFTREYKRRTTRDAVIYTTADWWSRCTGNTSRFSTTNPLWVARYANSVGTLPGKWPFYTFWQYSSSPIDQDRFSSTVQRLIVLAKG